MKISDTRTICTAPEGIRLVVVKVESLLVEAHQEVDRVALRMDLVHADPHLIHAGPALDLGGIGPDRLLWPGPMA